MKFEPSILVQSGDVIRVAPKLSCPMDREFLKSSNRIEVLNLIEGIELLLVDEISSRQIMDDGVPEFILLLPVVCFQEPLSNYLFFLFSK